MKKLIVYTLIIFSAASVSAQNKGSQAIYLNWNLGITNNNHFVNNDFSAAGATTGYSYFIRKNLAVGAEIGWSNHYSYSPRHTYQFKDGAVTTDMYKYLFTVPVTATVIKYFNIPFPVLPYAKLGLGAQYSEQTLFYNIYESKNSDWGFTAIPEIGVNIRLNSIRPLLFNVGAQFRYAGNRAAEYNISNLQSFNFNLGLIWQIN